MALPLDDIVNITINLPVKEKSGRQFNLALLVGSVSVFNPNERIRIYSSTDEMLEDGFLTSDRLYKSASLILSQVYNPNRVAIGKIGTVSEPNTASDGEILLTSALELNEEASVGKYVYLYTQGAIDEWRLSDSPVEGGLLVVADNPQEGEIALSAAQARNPNATIGKYIYHYTEDAFEEYRLSDTEVENGLLIVSDTVIRDETVEEFLSACRNANDEWYAVNICKEMNESEHITASQFCEKCTPSAIYCFTTSDDNALTRNENIFSQLKALGRRRTIGQYSSKNEDAICAIIGYAMGAITENLAFTLAYKAEIGVAVEDEVNTTGFNYLNENNGNIYVTRGTYNIFEQGKMADGSYFDEVIYLDKYQLEMQNSVMDLLTSASKIAQTEAGLALILAKINKVCNDMYQSNFIAGGVWKGDNVLNLSKGDTLPTGYLVQAESIDSQSQADREARKAPPIYVSLKLAGAFHYVTIVIDLNR